MTHPVEKELAECREELRLMAPHGLSGIGCARNREGLAAKIRMCKAVLGAVGLYERDYEPWWTVSIFELNEIANKWASARKFLNDNGITFMARQD